jgi:hypothetical protein
VPRLRGVVVASSSDSGGTVASNMSLSPDVYKKQKDLGFTVSRDSFTVANFVEIKEILG